MIRNNVVSMVIVFVFCCKYNKKHKTEQEGNPYLYKGKTYSSITS